MKLYETLQNVLRQEIGFTENGELKKWVIITKAQNCDPGLIGLLLENELLKTKFFIDVNGTIVFNQTAFIRFLEQKNYLNDSYTSYKNKIGLSIDGKYINQRNEIQLVWPFKDCILEGGQNNDEEKREEVFFNEILAQDEITQLLEPKILSNPKRYTTEGIIPFEKFKRSKDGLIADNLIIKGNNLLSLYCLKQEFAGKIKLIYIDPPYNTGGTGDTFLYNNSFKRSSWLTFMYNRLQIARELLTAEGALIVAIDENEQAYLGVLLKEVFRDFETHCITIVHNPRGVQGANFSYTHEYAFFVFPKGKKIITNKKLDDADIQWSSLRNWGGESLRTDAKNCFYPIIVDQKTSKIEAFGEICPDDFHPLGREIIKDGKIWIYPVDNDGVERKWRYARQSVEEIGNLLRARIKGGQWDIEIGKDFGQFKTVWVSPKYDANEYGTKIVKNLVPDNTFSFPKSLYNVLDCISAVVGDDKDAIILDYHAGSGSTAHAVLELNKDGGNRKFILCEQMDYIENITCSRVSKVMSNNHHGDFVYFELKKYNELFVERILHSHQLEDILRIWDQMKEKSFLNYNVDIKAQEQHMEEFKALSLEQQKQHLISLLDKNQLYVNLSSLNDRDFNINDEERRLTLEFYSPER